MKTRKYIRLDIEFEMTIEELIIDLQDLAEKYPKLKVWKGYELEFRTDSQKEDE